jgi:hypothetical protein
MEDSLFYGCRKRAFRSLLKCFTTIILLISQKNSTNGTTRLGRELEA